MSVRSVATLPTVVTLRRAKYNGAGSAFGDSRGDLRIPNYLRKKKYANVRA